VKVLAVDDEPQILRALRASLAARGHEVVTAPNGETALDVLATTDVDLVVLDLGLPGIDGLEVINRLRSWSRVPVIVLSVREAQADKIAALDAGADDFVTKPFGLDELHARLRVALRRAAGPGGDLDGRIVVGPLVFDAQRHEVRVGEQTLDLTPREFELLRVLLGEQGRIVTKGKLLRAVWGQAYQGSDSYVYVHVSQLRHKLAAADPTGELRDLIVTEPGIGYRVREPESFPPPAVRAKT